MQFLLSSYKFKNYDDVKNFDCILIDLYEEVIKLPGRGGALNRSFSLVMSTSNVA